MKSALIFLLCVAFAFACSGDCVSCHAPLADPKLANDRDHAVLLDCVECHKEIDSPKAECGGNCFACHSASSIDSRVERHSTLGGCQKCHISAAQSDFKSKLFNFDNESFEQKIERLAPK